MASVHLFFVPPDEQGIVKLLIEEGASSTGPFVQIDEVDGVGDYPDYLSEYTTQNADDDTNWFRIRWQDNGGAYTAYSTAVRGNTTSLVGKIVRRVLDRDSSLDIGVVTQEAEMAIESYYGVGVDPYSSDLSPSYRVLSGLTYLTTYMAVTSSITASSQAGDSVTLGLVTLKAPTSSSASASDVDKLLELANGLLGLNQSVVLQMQDRRSICPPVLVIEA